MHDYGWTVGVCTHTHDVVGSLLLLAWRSLWSLDGSLLGSLVAGGYRRLEGDGGMHEARNASGAQSVTCYRLEGGERGREQGPATATSVSK